MAVNYATKYQSRIAERFHKASVTDSACGNEYSFVGARTIRILSVNTAPEQDYNRTADGNRFGVPKNLGDTMQEMTMRVAKAFTFCIEPLDNTDQSIEKSAGRSLRRQLDEVTVPNMDRYRLKEWCSGANLQLVPSATLSKNNIVEAVIDANAMMTDELVPLEGRTLFISTAAYKLLKQNPEFIDNEKLGGKALAKGVVGEVDGLPVKPIVKSYLPTGVHFLIKYHGSTVDPVKFKQYDILQKVQGYAGPIVQGVTYYDSFVLGTKGDGLCVCGTSDFIMDAPTISLSGASATVTLSGADKILYTTDGTNPRYSTTAETYSSAVTLTAGQTIRAVGIKTGMCGKEASSTYSG